MDRKFSVLNYQSSYKPSFVAPSCRNGSEYEIYHPIQYQSQQVGMNSESTRLILDSLQKHETKFNFNHELLSEFVNITESVELRLALLERYSQR